MESDIGRAVCVCVCVCVCAATANWVPPCYVPIDL